MYLYGIMACRVFVGLRGVPGLGEWRPFSSVFRDGQLGQYVWPEEHETRAGRDRNSGEQREGSHRPQVRKKPTEKKKKKDIH